MVFVRLVFRVDDLVVVTIEVDEHRRTGRRSADEIPKSTKGMRSNHLEIVADLQPPAIALAPCDVKVVGPKINHHFQELSTAVNGPNYPRPDEVVKEDAWILAVEFASVLMNPLDRGNRPIAEWINYVFGMKLLIEPAIEPRFEESPIFGTRPKSAPV